MTVSPTSGVSSLADLIQRVARPIRFASEGGYARLSAVKNLGPFVSRQIVQALAERVYPPGIEADLLALRQLFADFDERLEPSEQRRRLSAARTLLARLTSIDSLGVQEQVRPADGSGNPSRIVRDLWNVPIRFARGVGPKRAAVLERLGVKTIEDACWFLPWRYEDRSVMTPIDRLHPGAEATICGVIDHVTARRTFRKHLNLVTVSVTDGTGRVDATFFNQPYLEGLLTTGVRVMVSGRVSAARRGWTRLELDNPQYEILGDQDEARLHVGRLVPVYHETKGLTSRQIRVLVRHILDDHAAQMEDAVPASVRDAYRLLPIQKAMPDVHFPDAGTSLERLNRGATEAHRRLVFEECLLLQLALAMRQRSVKEEPKHVRFDAATPLLDRLQRLLPFTLTSAQRRVVGDIQRDMASSHPMNRLIQGDVGCGKTMVALHAILIACGSGYQAALMVPTEILAEQHYLNLRRLLDVLGINTVVIKSGGGKSERRAATLSEIESGAAQVVVGTHALIQRSVRFKRLGLAVIDEQHKFGVLQRKVLVEKGYRPDVLVLTATPIPRTLALTVYGDLDISVIDALPPGRSPTTTWLFDPSQRRRAYRLLRDQVALGRQAYIVYPLVEESEKTDLQAAIQAAERLQADDFHQCRVGLLHGRMKADDKDRAMEAFKSGAIDILVATTVIEVGVDVPNATVMLIEHAERFGLAQLHQLRGRVGRGALQSYCLLLTSAATEMKRNAEPMSAARARMEALVRTTDGFLVAEEDLRIRGPGDFFGVRQWGIPEFRAANLLRDREILEQARKAAFDLLKGDPNLGLPLHRALRDATLRRWKDRLALAAIS